MSAKESCSFLTKLLPILESAAPLGLAEDWDNVGLLVVDRSYRHDKSRPYTVLLTNDLSPAVLAEAVASKVQMIVTYHPTPFNKMKKFDSNDHTANVILTAARHNICIYAPHTALDNVFGGINDWLLLGCFPATSKAVKELVVTKLPQGEARPVIKATLPGHEGAGAGRVVTNLKDLFLSDVIAALKHHLLVDELQLALPSSLQMDVRAGNKKALEAAKTWPVTSIAVCAGAGATILTSLLSDPATSRSRGSSVIVPSVFVTGEMSHHEILAANQAGVTVILTHHSKCERGYLQVLRVILEKQWNNDMVDDCEDKLKVAISQVDVDPLLYV